MKPPVEFRAEATRLGREFLVAIAAAVRAVRREPGRFRVVKRRTRRVLVERFPYMLLFDVEERRILVTAVFHLKRNPQRWSDRVRERVVALEPMEAFA